MKLLASFLFALALFCAGTARAQSVQIASPADGTLVSPGQTLDITVTGSPGVQTALITVEKPLPQVKELKPMHYRMVIPNDMPEGTYHIRAMGQSLGQFVQSDKIGLQVEWPQKLIKAEPYPLSISFDKIGENQPLHILGTFEGGRQLDVARSGRSAYVSTDINVVTVSLDGIVTSLGLGEAKVIFRNSGVLSVIPVKVEPINHGLIVYDIHMAAVSPLSRGPGDDYYVADIDITNKGSIPLAYVRIDEVKLNDQPANLLPAQKLNFLMEDKWNFKLGFTVDAGPRGSKSTLHVKGVYSPVPEHYHQEQPFESSYSVDLP